MVLVNSGNCKFDYYKFFEKGILIMLFSFVYREGVGVSIIKLWE